MSAPRPAHRTSGRLPHARTMMRKPPPKPAQPRARRPPSNRTRNRNTACSASPPERATMPRADRLHQPPRSHTTSAAISVCAWHQRPGICDGPQPDRDKSDSHLEITSIRKLKVPWLPPSASLTRIHVLRPGMTPQFTSARRAADRVSERRLPCRSFCSARGVVQAITRWSALNGIKAAMLSAPRCIFDATATHRPEHGARAQRRLGPCAVHHSV